MTFFITVFNSLAQAGLASTLTNLGGIAIQSVAAAGVGGFLSGTAAIFGAVSSIEAGKAESARAQFEAGQLQVEGQQAAANAKKEENEAREALLRTLASTNAAAGAAGIDIGSGTVESGRQEAFRQANREISTVRSDNEIQQLQRRGKIAQLRIDASTARRAGRLDAAFGLTDAAARSYQR